MFNQADFTAEGLRDLTKLFFSGMLDNLKDLYNAIVNKDIAKARELVKKVADYFEIELEAKEIDDVVAEILDMDTGGIMSELGDVLKLFGERIRKSPLPGVSQNPGFTIQVMNMGLPLGVPVQQWDRATSKKFFVTSAPAIKDTLVKNGIPARIVRRTLRNAPEVLDRFEGKTGAVAIDPVRLEKIFKVIRIAIPILTVASAAFPAILPVVVVLKLLLAWYDSTYPPAGVAVNTDRGLSLTDDF